MSTRALIGLFLAATAGIVIFLFVHLSSGPSGKLQVGARTAAAACTKGATGSECLPDVTYLDVDGRVYPRDQLNGKVVIVNFWATWCDPCRREIPAFSKVAEKYKDKVVMLGVMSAQRAPDPPTLLNFMSDNEMTYPVLRSTPQIEAAFEYPDVIPTTFIFDGRGVRREHRRGPMSEAQLSSVIDQLLGEL
jgi:thiol-disulfide isomerase/thioredoxin